MKKHKLVKPVRRELKKLKLGLIRNFNFKHKLLNHFMKNMKDFYKEKSFLPSVKITIKDKITIEVDKESEIPFQVLTLHMVLGEEDYGLYFLNVGG